MDTAGIRPTDDHVEKIGIERTKKAIAESDLVLFVIDLEKGWGNEEEEIATILSPKAFLLVGNKLDLCQAEPDLNGNIASSPSCRGQIFLSARTGERMDDLTGRIESFVFEDKTARQIPTLNARQAQLCLKAASALSQVMSTLEQGYPQDCLATDLKTAVDALSEISGESVSEEVIAEIFARFCIGK